MAAAPVVVAAPAHTPAPTAGPLLQRGAAGRSRRGAEAEAEASEAQAARTSPQDEDHPQAAGELSAAAGGVSMSTFFWNVHWQCSVAARGSSGACRARAAQRFAELAQGADVVASVELSNGMSDPIGLIPGWTQVNGPCARGNGGDSVALAFAPGWQVESSGGGCLRHDWDTRAFAVAKVTPPAAVQGCPSLCVVAIHAPHSSITQGRDVVAGVCGAAAEGCAVAMGDWNAPAHKIGRLWSPLIGGAPPTLAYPNERTCCWPESQHYGVFDHVATNIGGSAAEGFVVHPYQITEERPWQQHRPVSARLLLPAARCTTRSPTSSALLFDIFGQAG